MDRMLHDWKQHNRPQNKHCIMMVFAIMCLYLVCCCRGGCRRTAGCSPPRSCQRSMQRCTAHSQAAAWPHKWSEPAARKGRMRHKCRKMRHISHLRQMLQLVTQCFLMLCNSMDKMTTSSAGTRLFLVIWHPSLPLQTVDEQPQGDARGSGYITMLCRPNVTLSNALNSSGQTLLDVSRQPLCSCAEGSCCSCRLLAVNMKADSNWPRLVLLS
jgi:hypothetical protein